LPIPGFDRSNDPDALFIRLLLIILSFFSLAGNFCSESLADLFLKLLLQLASELRLCIERQQEGCRQNKNEPFCLHDLRFHFKIKINKKM